MNKLTFTLLLAFSLRGLPQEAVTFTGKVVDAETSEALPFSTIHVRNTPHGVVANKNGEFDLIVTEGDEIEVSTLGYLPRTFQLNTLKRTSQNVLGLTNQPILLTEVIVSGEKEQLIGEEILKQAIKNQKKNFPTDNYALSVFFRETIQVDSQHAKLVEAAATIHGKKYPNRTKKVFIDQIRTSNDVEMPEPVATHLANYNPFREFQSLTGKIGKIRACKSCTYEVEGYISHHGKPAVIIGSVRNSPKFPRFFRYTIDLESFAVLTLEFESTQAFGQGLPSDLGTYQSNLNYLRRVYSFQEYNGSYYLSRYHQQAVFEYRSRTDSTDSHQTTHDFTIVTNNYQAATEAPTEEENEMSYKDQISEAKKSYNPDFWKSYNILKQNSLDQKIIDDLSKNQSVDSLFSKEK